MQQQTLDFLKPSPKSPLDRARLLDAQNLQAARRIVASPERYRGLTLNWARAVIERLAPGELERDSCE